MNVIIKSPIDHPAICMLDFGDRSHHVLAAYDFAPPARRMVAREEWQPVKRPLEEEHASDKPPVDTTTDNEANQMLVARQPSAPEQASSDDTRIALNTATAAELQQLPASARRKPQRF